MSNIYDDASLILYPSGYKASKLYSLKPTDGSGDLDVVRATTATRVNSDGLIEEVAINVPRIDYTGGGCGKLLLEPQRTNLLTYSEEFDNAVWTKPNSATVTSNAIISPDGTLTADALNFASVASSVFGTVTVVSGQSYTFSVYAKAGNNSDLRLEHRQSAVNEDAVFDLSNGTLTSGTGNIVFVGNGWYRCSITETASDTSDIFIISSTTSVSGDFFYIWGAQLEEGSYPSSYIPTVAAAVTRNADVVSKTGISSLIGQTQGTMFFEFDLNNIIPSESQYIGVISDGSASNRIQFLKNLNNNFQVFISSSGAANINIEVSTSGVGTYKTAIAYESGNIAFYVNGVQEATSSSAIDFLTLTDFDLGQRFDDLFPLQNPISQALLFPTRLTNAELETLTTL